MSANDVIPFEVFRRLIQDTPKKDTHSFMADGETIEFQLPEYPILETQPITVSVESTPLATTDFNIDYESGRLLIPSYPYGFTRVEYYYAQLGDDDIEACLDTALKRHDPSLTWDTIEEEDAVGVQMLAVSLAFYMLAARWATETRIRVEDTEIHEHHVGTKYFEMAGKAQEGYDKTFGGKITVSEVTRRDVGTGLLVPLTEVWYS